MVVPRASPGADASASSSRSRPSRACQWKPRRSGPAATEADRAAAAERAATAALSLTGRPPPKTKAERAAALERAAAAVGRGESIRADPVLAERGKRAMDPARLAVLMAEYVDSFKPSPVCGSLWHPGQTDEETTDTLQFNVGPYRFKILTRSTNSIYQFLGKVL